jgi:hypothetical protein
MNDLLELTVGKMVGVPGWHVDRRKTWSESERKERGLERD